MEQELIQRWSNFLAKIESRFNESLQYAEEACLEFIKENDYDYYETTQTMAGMSGQIRTLIQKIDQTWDEKVGPQMRDTFQNADWTDQRVIGSNLSIALWEKLNAFETVLEGKLSKLYYDHTIQLAERNFHCSQCKAQLTINKRIYRPQYVTCDYCETINTFEPETKYTQLGWGIIDNIIKLDLLEEKSALDKNYQMITENAHSGKATKQDWENYKTQYLAYHQHFFKERIKLNVDYEKRFEDDMERKLKEFNEWKAQQIR